MTEPQMPLDPFLGGPMPGKDAAIGEIRLQITGRYGPIIDVPLMEATAKAQTVDGVLFTFEYHPPCPHDDDEPCDCSPETRQAVLRLDVLPDPAFADERPATETARLQINAGGAIKLNDLQIAALPAECRPARSTITRVALTDIWRAIGPDLAAYITGRPAEPDPRSGYCIDERCGRNGLHQEHS